MLVLFLQSLLLLTFGVALFFLWRTADPSERWLRWIVAVGFLARALIGQALFWIAWAGLPLLRSLQRGDGYWIFAQDSAFYFPQAVAAAEKGLHAVIFYDRGAPSVSYMQLLAGSVALLGHQLSVGILVNLFCYLGTIALLVRWGRAQPQTRTAVAVAIAAISLSPSLVLWSLQPLKDSFFQLLFVAFVVACAAWQRRPRVATGALMAVVLYVLAGIRWYFAGTLIAATALFLLIVTFTAPERKKISFGAAVMIFILALSLVLSAGPYLPPLAPRSIVATIEQTRRGFDTTPASTMIRSGKRLTIAPPAPRPAPPAELPADIRIVFDRQVDAWNHHDVQRFMDGYWKSPDFEMRDSQAVTHGWRKAFDSLGALHRSGAAGQLTYSDLRMNRVADGVASIEGRWELTRGNGMQGGAVKFEMRRFPTDGWKIVRVISGAPPAATAAASPATPSTTRVERLLLGAAALVVPRTLGERLGLFDIGGGRGLLWFTEIDTLTFDAVLIFALWALFAVPAWRNALVWLVLLTTLIVGATLAYSISNFGTLFRLREMIYLGVLLIPIAATSPRLDPVT